MIELPLYYLVAIFVFVFGAIIGSFLNVLILRFGTGFSASGRSRCFSCNRVLGVIDLVPIVSFVFLGGKCRTCYSRVSFQYPLVEALTAFIFVLIYISFFGNSDVLTLLTLLKIFFSCIVASVLIVITIYDLRHKIIPNPYVYAFIALGVIATLYRVWLSFPLGVSIPLILDILSGPLLFLFFYALWAVSKGKWMGFGDAKLVLGIGLLLGFWSGFSAVMIGFWIGALFGIALMLLPKVLPDLRLKGNRIAVTMHSEIPFAPFLILGMAIAFFFHINVFFILS